MNKLTKIIYNCRQATFLIEKKEIAGLTLRERMELKIHLAGCVVCRVFQEQSVMINKMVREMLDQSPVKLSDRYKQALQERINEEMNRQ